MMDMGIGSIISGGLGFAGAMMQAEEQAETRDMNWAVAIMNYQQRERERAEAIAMALKQRKEQQLGSTDIRGTRTKFVPGQGWVTTGAPDVLDMMKLQDAEQKKVLQHDLPQRRQVADRNYVRGLQDEGTADTLKRMFVNALAPAKSDEGYANDLYQAQAMGLREASADAGRRAWTQAMRTQQNSNFDEIASGMQRESNRAYANAALQAKLMSRGVGEKERQGKLSSLSNLYNMFATRAGQLPETNYRPQTLDTKGTLDQSMAGGLQTGNAAIAALGKKGGELDYLSPLTGYGNAVAGLGSSLGSAFNRMGAQKAYEDSRGGVTGFGGSGSYNQGDMYLDEERGAVG
jgi:hypothetical protein